MSKTITLTTAQLFVVEQALEARIELCSNQAVATAEYWVEQKAVAEQVLAMLVAE